MARVAVVLCRTRHLVRPFVNSVPPRHYGQSDCLSVSVSVMGRPRLGANHTRQSRGGVEACGTRHSKWQAAVSSSR